MFFKKSKELVNIKLFVNTEKFLIKSALKKIGLKKKKIKNSKLAIRLVKLKPVLTVLDILEVLGKVKIFRGVVRKFFKLKILELRRVLGIKSDNLDNLDNLDNFCEKKSDSKRFLTL